MGFSNKGRLSALALASILATTGAAAPAWQSGAILKHSSINKPWLRKKKGRS